MTHVYFIVLRLSLNSQFRKKDNPRRNKRADERESCYWQLRPSRIIQKHGADGGGVNDSTSWKQPHLQI